METKKLFSISSLLCLFLLISFSVFSTDLPVADFSVPGNNIVVWSENFDDVVTSGWTYQVSNNNFSWELRSNLAGNKSFTGIDPQNVASMFIEGVYATRYGSQDEWLISPEISVPANASLSFYAAYSLFSSSTVMNVKLKVSEVNSETWVDKWDGKTQSPGEMPISWRLIHVDLKEFSGKTIRLAWVYTSNVNTNKESASDFVLDDIKLYKADEKEKISIHTGDSIEFIDLSAGEPTSWQWEFEEGTPAVSAVKNPIVRYYKPGTYAVKLTVSNTSGNDSKIIEGMVVVEDQDPVAKINAPSAFRGKDSRGFFVPIKENLLFSDGSSNYPSYWNWTFNGGSLIGETYESQALVNYSAPGYYSVLLDVENTKGNSSDMAVVEAGVTSFIRNYQLGDISDFFKMDENQYFPGNNLKIEAYAEHFAKPAIPMVLDSVEITFIGNRSSEDDLYNRIQTVSVTICKDENGQPGEELAYGSWMVIDIHVDGSNPCGFPLGKELLIDFPFFVVVKGIPMDNTEGLNLTIAMAKWRSQGNTTYILKKGETKWQTADSYFGKERQTSLNITPRVTYAILSPDRDVVYLPATQSSEIVNIYAPIYSSPYVWSATSDQGWCNVTNQVNNTAQGTVTITCENNILSEERVAWVTLGNSVREKKIQIIQSGISTSLDNHLLDGKSQAFFDNSGMLNIQYPDGVSSVSIFGIDGRKYTEKTLSSDKNSEILQLSSLGKGIYMVVFSGINNLQTIKIIK